MENPRSTRMPKQESPRSTRVPKHVGFLALPLVLLTALATATQPSAPSLLLYGFEPFGDFDVNPSAGLVERLASGQASRRAAVLPVSPPDALGALFHLMADEPDFIIGFGVRSDVEVVEVNVEAINWLSMRTAGEPPFFGTIELGLPSSLVLQSAWLEHVRGVVDGLGESVRINIDSGMHACNLTFFHALLHASPSARVLFIHVPPDVHTRPDLLQHCL